jgi:hypothetical protein
MKEKDLKAVTHGALALVGLVEAFDSRSRVRKLLTGCVVGWHCWAAYYHIFLEEEIKSEIILDSEIEFW